MGMASGVDLAVVGIYMILMVAVGIVVSYFNKDSSDFFRGGNRLPWWLSGLSLFMCSFSAFTFTGAAGVAYRAPLVAVAMYGCNAAAFIWAVWFLAARWRRSRSTTVMSYLSERYGISTNQFYSYAHLGMAIVQSGVMLLSLSKFVSVAIGAKLETTIIVCGMVISIYCLIGGLWAVAITDALQFMVLFPCALVACFLAFYHMGGPVSMVAASPAGLWTVTTEEFSWTYLTAYAIMMAFAYSSGSAAQRYFSVRDETDARKVALLTMGLSLMAPIVWFAPPIAARLLNIDLASITVGVNAPQEAAYVAFCLKYLPHGALGIVLAAILSATMSSLSGNFNLYAAVITEDIIKQVFWKNATGKQLLFLGRVMTLVLGCLVTAAAIAQATVKGGVFLLMMTISGAFILPAGIPIIFGLFYRRASRWSGMASFGVGLFISIVYLVYMGQRLSFIQQVFLAGGVSAAIYFGSGLLSKARGEYKLKLEAFFKKVTTPISREEVGDSEATDVGSFRITGWTTVFMGFACMTLAVPKMTFGGRMINLAIGAVMALFGAFLLAACEHVLRKKRKRSS